MHYADPGGDGRHPGESGDGYAGVALDVIEALETGAPLYTALNVPNGTAIDGFATTTSSRSALMAHPLVLSYSRARGLADDYLQAHGLDRMSVELACTAPAFLDLTFVGLRALPAPGQEEFATDLLRSPGGGALNAIGAARLGCAPRRRTPTQVAEVVVLRCAGGVTTHIHPSQVGTYVRASSDGTSNGARSRGPGGQRLRGLTPARRATADRARLARVSRPAAFAVLAADEPRRVLGGGLRGAARPVPRRRPYLGPGAHPEAPPDAGREIPDHRPGRRRPAGPIAPCQQGGQTVPARRSHGHAARISPALDMLVPAARGGQEARPSDRARAMAARARGRGAVVLPARLHPIGRLIYINRTGRYAYLSYEFANLSADVKALFVEVCRSVGVESRSYARCVRIYRRESVALMQAHVGSKA